MASALASPIELTPDVAKATADHLAAHAAATAGEHAILAPAQVAAAYLADSEDVAAAKVEFQKYFDAAVAGTPIIPAFPTAPVAPVAPVGPQTVLPANYFSGFYPGYTGLTGLTGYPYYNGYYGLPYGGYQYHGLPFIAAPAATEEKSE